MRVIAQKIANYITKETKDQESEEVVSYGIEVVLGALLQFIVILGTAAILGVFWPVLAVLFSAVIYRIFSGGAHCSDFYRCLTLSLLVFIPLGYLVNQLAYSEYNYTIITVGMLLVLISTLRWAPAENPKHPIKAEKRQRFKFICLILIALFLAVFWVMPTNIFITGIFVGLLWQAFTITPWGTTCLHLADKLMIKVVTIFKRREAKT